MRGSYTFRTISIIFVLMMIAGCSSEDPAEPAQAEDEGGSDGDDYPEESLTWVVHCGPGCGADVFTRQLSEIASDADLYPEGIQVENREGGGGAIAYTSVSESGDPHILMSTTPNIVSTYVQGNSPDPTDSEAFTPIANLITDDYVLYVNADSEFESLSDLLDAAEENPGEITQGGGTPGGSDHQAGHLIQQAADVEFNFISHEGGGAAQTALLGGHVDFALGQYNEGIENVEAGEFRALAVLTEERLDAAPDLPTAQEQGLDVQFGIARGVYAPGNIPDEAREYLTSMISDLTETDAYQSYIGEIQSRPNLITGDDYIEFMESEVTRTEEVLADMNLSGG